MIQLKIFASNSVIDMENTVNEFLQPEMEIVKVVTTSYGVTHYLYIFYRFS